MNPEPYKEPYTMTKWDLSQECRVASTYESNNKIYLRRVRWWKKVLSDIIEGDKIQMIISMGRKSI